MQELSLSLAAQSRLKHIEQHLEVGFNISSLTAHIINHTGNRTACFGRLGDHALAKAMWTWFVENDLCEFKKWCYTGGRLYQEMYRINTSVNNPGPKFLALMMPLLSDDNELVTWFVNELQFDLERIENPSTYDFWAFQGIVALTGDWGRLKQRCTTALRAASVPTQLQKYTIDHEFYAALAAGDKSGMEAVISRLASDKSLLKRDEFGFTRDLISTPAVIYSKIARRHGFTLEIDSVFVPKDWIVSGTLDRYSTPYAFLD